MGGYREDRLFPCHMVWECVAMDVFFKKGNSDLTWGKKIIYPRGVIHCTSTQSSSENTNVIDIQDSSGNGPYVSPA